MTQAITSETKADLLKAFSGCATDEARFELFASVQAACDGLPIGSLTHSAMVRWNRAADNQPETLVKALSDTPAKHAILFGQTPPLSHEPGAANTLGWPVAL